MRRFTLVILAVALPILAGCSGSGDSGPVELEPLPEPAAQSQQEEEEPGGLSFIDRTVPVETQEELTYFAASTAPECPRVPVADQRGEKLRLDPVQHGVVTIVVFWGTNDPNSLGALQHVSELVHQYRRFRVRGVTIVGRTPGSDRAREFLDSRGVSMPVYWDDTSWSGLKRMANAADAQTPTAVPAIFILDRAGRVRLYRPGFRFTVQIEDLTRPNESQLVESAPPGKRVVNYLERILRES